MIVIEYEMKKVTTEYVLIFEYKDKIRQNER